VANFFENSDIIALPYITGTQSGVLALSFGFGKPTVATNVGSIAEVLEHDVNGILVPPADKEQMAKALIDLLTNEGKCFRIAEQATQTANTLLSWETIANQTHQLYLEVVR